MHTKSSILGEAAAYSTLSGLKTIASNLNLKRLVAAGKEKDVAKSLSEHFSEGYTGRVSPSKVPFSVRHVNRLVSQPASLAAFYEGEIAKRTLGTLSPKELGAVHRWAQGKLAAPVKIPEGLRSHLQSKEGNSLYRATIAESLSKKNRAAFKGAPNIGGKSRSIADAIGISHDVALARSPIDVLSHINHKWPALVESAKKLVPGKVGAGIGNNRIYKAVKRFTTSSFSG